MPETCKIDISKRDDKYRLTELEKEELATRVRAMTEEEMLVALDNIPVELCIQRIVKELDKNKAFFEAVNQAVDILGVKGFAS